MMELSFDERKGKVCYTSRDLIIYAFGIGCNIEELSESRYIYEHNNNFSAFPLFPLTLPFRAATATATNNVPNNRMFDLPPFPPPMMKGPRGGGGESEEGGGAVIHLSQKYRLHRPIPVTRILSSDDSNNNNNPVQVDVTTRTLSILPKKRGTIVVTETNYYISGGEDGDKDGRGRSSKQLFATSQAATLYPIVADGTTIIKTSPSNGLKSPIETTPSTKAKFKNIYSTKKPTARKTYSIGNNQALLYRLSGDTNRIHVEGSPLFHSTQPILHGLCTLSYAVRALQSSFSTLRTKIHDGPDLITVPPSTVECRYVECQFTKPVFVGDEIEVYMWWGEEFDFDMAEDDSSRSQSQSTRENMDVHDNGVHLVLFQVRRVKDNTIVLNGGIAELYVASAITLGSASAYIAVHSKL